MKNFNKIIKVEIEANQIAQLLLKQMNEKFAHAELVVETIISTSDEFALSLLYNSLCGFSPDVNFTVGQQVDLKDHRAYGYWTEESIEQKSSVRQDVTSAKIVEIDVYRTDKIKVMFLVPQADGKFKEENTWISHLKCSELTSQEPYALVD